jgi:hypothetical protein
METYAVDLFMIKDIFPEQSDRIDMLYSTDRDFQSLCSDYCLSINTLQGLRIEADETLSAIVEFQGICSDLANELERYLAHL